MSNGTDNSYIAHRDIAEMRSFTNNVGSLAATIEMGKSSSRDSILNRLRLDRKLYNSLVCVESPKDGNRV